MVDLLHGFVLVLADVTVTPVDIPVEHLLLLHSS